MRSPDGRNLWGWREGMVVWRSKNATPPFLINKCHLWADTRPLLRLMLFKTDKFSLSIPLCVRRHGISRIITAIRKWTCANYFKRTTKIDRFRTDIFGPYNLWRLSPPISRRKSRNFHNAWSYKYNNQSLRWLYGNIYHYRFARRSRVSTKPSSAVILRRYRQSPYSRLYKFSVTSRATYGYSRGQRNGSAIFPEFNALRKIFIHVTTGKFREHANNNI